MALVSRPWGVTPALVASRVQSMKLASNSQPSIADVERIIRGESGWVAGRLRRVGVGPDLEEGSETFDLASEVLMDLVTAKVDTLRGRKDTDMASVRAEARERIDAIDRGPQGLGDEASTSRNHRVMTSARRSREVRTFNAEYAPRGVRMATDGEL